MSSLITCLSESRKKEISLELGRILTKNEKDLIQWLSKHQAFELTKK
ncbi:hypothetical protein [Salipaludibacillus keqinensis]|nr:hypothetical protein [Salipaludibacillus keqinensis]